MSGPDIFIVVHVHGDGYGHNSYEYVGWYFDEREAEAVREVGGSWFNVERVPAGSPMKAREF